MPNYKGHVAGGVATYCIIICLAVSCKPSLVTALEWLGFTLAGALFPDVDVKSRGQKYFYYFVFLFFIVLVIQGKHQAVSYLSFITITPMLSRHRGIFHNPRFLIIMPLCAWAFVAMIYPWIASPLLMSTLFFIAGALSHKFLDTYA